MKAVSLREAWPHVAVATMYVQATEHALACCPILAVTVRLQDPRMNGAENNKSVVPVTGLECRH